MWSSGHIVVVPAQHNQLLSWVKTRPTAQRCVETGVANRCGLAFRHQA